MASQHWSRGSARSIRRSKVLQHLPLLFFLVSIAFVLPFMSFHSRSFMSTAYSEDLGFLPSKQHFLFASSSHENARRRRKRRRANQGKNGTVEMEGDASDSIALSDWFYDVVDMFASLSMAESNSDEDWDVDTSFAVRKPNATLNDTASFILSSVLEGVESINHTNQTFEWEAPPPMFADGDEEILQPTETKKDPTSLLLSEVLRGHDVKEVFKEQSFRQTAVAQQAKVLPRSSTNTTTTTTTARNKLPYLILHMGPDKTGTTAIQSFLHQYSTLFAEDGYNISFSKGTRNKVLRQTSNGILDCFIFSKHLRHPCHNTNPDQWKTRLQALLPSTPDSHMIWSTEGFRWANFAASKDWSNFLHYLQDYYQIRVVLVYRRYFDWVISRYNEGHQSNEYSGNAFLQWPDEHKDGIGIPTFEDYYVQERNGSCPLKARGKKSCQNYFVNRREEGTNRTIHWSAVDGMNEQDSSMLGPPTHPVLAMARQLEALNVTVEIVNFHGKPAQSLLPRLVCTMLSPPDTPIDFSANVNSPATEAKACRQAMLEAGILESESTNLGTTPKRKNQQEERTIRKSNLEQLQYDRLGLEAHRLELLPQGMDRNSAKASIHKYYKLANKTILGDNQPTPMQWICPTAVLQELQSVARDFEEQVLKLVQANTKTATAWEFTEPHDEAFASSQDKFCHVNTTQVLSDPALQGYLRNLTLPLPQSQRKAKRKRKPEKH